MLLKAILGISKPTKGSITIDGVNIYKKKMFLQNSGVLIEDNNFINSMTGLNYLIFLSKISSKISKEIIIEYLKKYDMYENKDIKISNYSQGMLQKIGIIQALMENPKYILLDEPFNYLDIKAINTLKNDLLSMKENKIIILTSHVADDFEGLINRKIFIKEGKIIQGGAVV